MLFVDNHNHHDPSFNLALEEYVVRNIAKDEDILLFYINEPAIIIGRHQNTIEEIAVDYVEQHGIHVVRRISGGGAVYHDLGNLNFSFTVPKTRGAFIDFQKFTAPVVEVLRNMGVPAELSGRNDIVVEGKKISGNAQYISSTHIMSHGTLLYASDLDEIGHALRVKPSKIESKGIKSVRSRVANISEFLSNPPDILQFRQQVLEGIFKGAKVIPQVELTPADWRAVEQLAQSRYRSWEWNYGASPAFNLKRETRYAGGGIEALLMVEKGILESVKFYGDFFSQRDVAELEALLANCPYEPQSLEQRLEQVDVDQYFSSLTAPELLALLY